MRPPVSQEGGTSSGASIWEMITCKVQGKVTDWLSISPRRRNIVLDFSPHDLGSIEPPCGTDMYIRTRIQGVSETFCGLFPALDIMLQPMDKLISWMTRVQLLCVAEEELLPTGSRVFFPHNSSLILQTGASFL